MDPFTLMAALGPSLIGGGMSLAGGLMNTSSTQAINAANIQNQMWSAQGGYLPGLVANANKAGLNPLAVLGSRGPNMAVQVGTQPGAGLQEFGRDVARLDPQMRELQLDERREALLKEAAINKGMILDNAIKQETFQGIQSGKYIPPGVSQPAQDVSIPGAAIQGAKDFGNWVSGQYGRIPQYIRRPQDIPFDRWRRFVPDSTQFSVIQ